MTMFSCEFCSANFSCIEQAVVHVNSHKVARKSCFVPGCKKTLFGGLSRHIRKSHSRLCKYSCDFCKAVFVRECDLQRHKSMKLHSQEVLNRYRQPIVPYTGSMSFYRPVSFENLYNFMSRGLQQRSVNFFDSVSVEDLNKFINEELQPTEEVNKEMKKIVDQICDLLRRNMSPNQIVKGGSMGKGTAIKGRSDIDLVLVLNNVENAEDLKKKLPEIKNEIQEILKRESESFDIVPSSFSDTTFLVKFTVASPYGNIDVDLLPTFHFKDLRDLYRNMKYDEPHIQYYSASLVKQQVMFVQKYPPNVKNLIRLVKYWKKQNVFAKGSQRVPNSYVMELITIHLWEKNKEQDGTFNTLKAFRSVMEALKNYQSLNTVWGDNYSENEIPIGIRQQRPLVMDPANPTNNVCHEFSWKEIQDAAEKVLESPMMRGVTSNNWK